MMSHLYERAINAENQIRPYIRETPLDYSISLSKESNSNVYLKFENLQYTGAFKVRGAFNKLLSLMQLEKNMKGVVTASSGNHGAAVAYGLHTLKLKGMVFVPENASKTKIDNIQQYDVPVELYETDCLQTEIFAKQYAKKNGMIYISPYNDPDIIAGQGTIGLELGRQLDNIDCILVPIGGGGLISGIAGVIKSQYPSIEVIGCLPGNSPVMAESIKAGKLIEMACLPTLSDATAGGIEPDAITFKLCQKYVDDYILVTEDEIRQAIISIMKTHHQLIEGAAGVAVAALLKNAKAFEGKNVVIILSGGNIGLDTLKAVLG